MRKSTAPLDLPKQNKLIELLPVSKYAYEVSRMNTKEPNRLRDAHTITTDQDGERLDIWERQ